jgi:hypothetical protein
MSKNKCPTGQGGAVKEAQAASLSINNNSMYAGHKSNIYACGKVVGCVENAVFKKTIIGSKHILRRPLALAFDVCSLEDASRAGAARCEVFDKQSGVHYCADIERIFSKGFRFNRGFGDQIALPLEAWMRYTTGAAQQLDLFAAL